jgi:hypothetical protein
MSPSPILSPSDEEKEHLLSQPDAEADKAEAIDSDEEEERLLTQPDTEADKAEAIDLTVESEPPTRSGQVLPFSPTHLVILTEIPKIQQI